LAAILNAIWITQDAPLVLYQFVSFLSCYIIGKLALNMSTIRGRWKIGAGVRIDHRGINRLKHFRARPIAISQ